jgi:hypothetical protein
MTHHDPHAGAPGGPPRNPDLIIEEALQFDPMLRERPASGLPWIVLTMCVLIVGITLYAANRPEPLPGEKTAAVASAPAPKETPKETPKTTTGEAPTPAAQQQTGQGRPDNEGKPAQATPAEPGKR